MSDVNTVAVISDKKELIEQITKKLVLLRNLDKIKSCSIEEAQNTIENFSPNVLIIHCEHNNPNSLNLIKKIRHDKLYNNIPIVLVNENCSREVVIEAFDSGINDVVFTPLIDYELLIRTIWALKRNEVNLNFESRNSFLANLGIIQPETGVIAQKYCDEYLKNEISLTKKYSQRACILLVAPDKKYPNYKNPKEFISIINKSVRLNDSVIIKDLDKFYVYLQKTKLNGAYSVFERINNNLGIDCGANAGVIEVQEQKFDDIKEALDAALQKANENTNSLIVASDFYSPVSSAGMDDTIIRPEDIQQEDSIVARASKNADTASIKLFNQAYERKLKVVIAPVFKKYENMIRMKKHEFAINSYTGTKSVFNITAEGAAASMLLDYDGVQHIFIKLLISKDGQKRLFETETLDFTSLDYRRVSLLLSGLIEKFSQIVKSSDKK